MIALLFFVASVEAVDINCEIRRLHDEIETCCYLNNTAIQEENVEIGGSENVKIDTILLSQNKKIKFLPVKIHNKLPELKLYNARNANIEKISALNFVGLSKLQFLDLSHNKFEFIPDDCFLGLKALQKINLSKKKH